MKKIIALLLACIMLIALAACGIAPEETLIDPTETSDIGCPTSNPIEKETTYDPYHDCTTTTAPPQAFTSSRDDIAPLDPVVRMFDADGKEIELYSELVYFTDGMVVGDGALMFMSVSSRLPAIADKIPLVNFGGTPEIIKTAREGVSIRGGETVNVYGEDYALLAEKVPFAELSEKGNSEWQGKTVYIYFTVTFSDDTPDYEKKTCNGYFVKTVFSSHSAVELIGADGEPVEMYSEMIWSGPADFELAFVAVENYLPRIAKQIPLVVLNENSEIRITAYDGMTVSGGETVSVYDEDYTCLDKDIPLSEVFARGKNSWRGKTVYIYFTVSFTSEAWGSGSGYFVKTAFA